MILARITSALRQQNWVAVALEFLVVVAGVVIGFAVSDWAGERDERATEHRHLIEIAEDLELEIDRYDELIESALYRIAGVNAVHQAATGEDLPDRLTLSTRSFDIPDLPEIDLERRSLILGQINLVRISVGNRSGYDSLISSGNLELLRNDALSRAIQLYYSNHDNLTDTQVLFRQFRNDGVQLGYELGLSAFDVRPFDEIVEAARQSPQFLAYLRTTREWAVIHANLMLDRQAEARELLGEINAYLEDGS